VLRRLRTVTNHAIYHITHADNLQQIVREGRLWCDAQRIARGLANTNIGYSHIKVGRMRHPVTEAAVGTLGNYVPFNFCRRSVMLYVVAQGSEDYWEGRLPTLFPTVGLIDEFERFTTGCLPRQRNNDDKATMLATMRDALLPRLISGELRVKDVERSIEVTT
jgi:hypothetical protein